MKKNDFSLVKLTETKLLSFFELYFAGKFCRKKNALGLILGVRQLFAQKGVKLAPAKQPLPDFALLGMFQKFWNIWLND